MPRDELSKEQSAMLTSLYSADELTALEATNARELKHHIFVTAETILRRRSSQEAGSALASLDINYHVATQISEESDAMLFLARTLELLLDQRSREHFKQELGMLIRV